MSDTNLAEEFIDAHGQEAYEQVKEHAGTHATETGSVSANELPSDEDDLFLYGLVEIAEHECACEQSECELGIDDDDVFNFLLTNFSEVAERIRKYPPRGASQLRQDLNLIYPFSASVDVQVEIDSETSEGELKPLTVLGHDMRSPDGDPLLVCLVPCQESVNDPETIPDRFPLNRGVPEFAAEIDDPVEVVVPVPEGVWRITADISPGFMTLDGWDYDAENDVTTLIGMVSKNDPEKSRTLLGKLIGEDKAWHPGR